MQFHITYDESGDPIHVHTDNGFMQTSRKFDHDTDGWMLDQLNPMEFQAIRAGRDMEYLVAEVNTLRRRLFELEKQNDSWRKAAGF